MKNLAPILRAVRLKDGEHIIDTHSNGFALIGHVKGGKFVNWHVRTPQGAAQGVVYAHETMPPLERPRTKPEPVKPETPRGEKPCYICYETTESFTCWLVPCDALPFPPGHGPTH